MLSLEDILRADADQLINFLGDQYKYLRLKHLQLLTLVNLNILGYLTPLQSQVVSSQEFWKNFSQLSTSELIVSTVNSLIKDNMSFDEVLNICKEIGISNELLAKINIDNIRNINERVKIKERIKDLLLLTKNKTLLLFYLASFGEGDILSQTKTKPQDLDDIINESDFSPRTVWQLISLISVVKSSYAGIAGDNDLRILLEDILRYILNINCGTTDNDVLLHLTDIVISLRDFGVSGDYMSEVIGSIYSNCLQDGTLIEYFVDQLRKKDELIRQKENELIRQKENELIRQKEDKLIGRNRINVNNIQYTRYR